MWRGGNLIIYEVVQTQYLQIMQHTKSRRRSEDQHEGTNIQDRGAERRDCVTPNPKTFTARLAQRNEKRNRTDHILTRELLQCSQILAPTRFVLKSKSL